MNDLEKFNHLWREVLTGNNHRVLSNFICQSFNSIIKFAEEKGIIQLNQNNIIVLNSVDVDDLSETCKLLSKRFEANFEHANGQKWTAEPPVFFFLLRAGAPFTADPGPRNPPQEGESQHSRARNSTHQEPPEEREGKRRADKRVGWRCAQAQTQPVALPLCRARSLDSGTPALFVWTEQHKVLFDVLFYRFCC